jgi:prepilin-type N-terminal cleavage/methylation domain-containing protein
VLSVGVSSSNLRRRAFSLVEVLAVIVILAIVATVAVPRFSGWGDRQAREDAAAVADILSTAARREAQTIQKVAIEFRGDTGEVAMLTLTRASLAEPGVWSRDPLVPVAQMRSATFRSILVDGVELDPKHARVEFSGNSGARPFVDVTVAGDQGRSVWRVLLTPGSMQARVSTPFADAGISEETVDLDAVGRSGEPW